MTPSDSHRPRWWPPVLIAVLGAVGTAAALASAATTAHDAVRLVGEAVAASAAASALAWIALVAMRRAAIGAQLVVATLAPVAAVGLAVWWASSEMFLMGHDVSILTVVLVVAGTVGLIAALLLGRRVGAASRTIEALARQIGDEADRGTTRHPSTLAGVRAPGELAALADELQSTADRLTAARAQSDALERSRRELVAWVSHDLRTPLAGIRAMAEALEDGIVDDTETVSRYHRVMRQETERLAGLVNDLFELSRIQSGVLDLDLEPVGLDELLTEATAGASIAASSKGVSLVGPGTGSAPIVALSTAEMSRVVRNLLDNAIRHTPSGGTVEVGAGAAADGARLWVQDGCGGIPSAVAERVFDAAYRGDRARTPGDGRAGLGLAVARGLVEAHGAQIEVANHGEGCRFTVTFPSAVAGRSSLQPRT